MEFFAECCTEMLDIRRKEELTVGLLMSRAPMQYAPHESSLRTMYLWPVMTGHKYARTTTVLMIIL